MKKILTICLLVAITCAVNAQQKPTKEETIAFMNRTLKSTIGFEGMGGKVIEIDFNQNTYTKKTYYDLAGGFYSNYIISGIPWDKLEANKFEVRGLNLRIFFSQGYRHQYKVDDRPEKIEFISSLDITLPSDKIESFKKACIRLCEIYKEENKDPFKN